MSDYTIKPAGKNLYTIRRGTATLRFGVPFTVAVQAALRAAVHDVTRVAA